MRRLGEFYAYSGITFIFALISWYFDWHKVLDGEYVRKICLENELLEGDKETFCDSWKAYFVEPTIWKTLFFSVPGIYIIPTFIKTIFSLNLAYILYRRKWK